MGTRSILCVAALGALLLGGCGEGPTGTDPWFEADGLVGELMKAAPRFVNENVAWVSARGTLGPVGPLEPTPGDPNPFNVVYSTFKDFDLSRPDETSAQGVDGSNFWVALYQALDELSLVPTDDPTAYRSFSVPALISPSFALAEGTGVLYSLGGGYSHGSYDMTWAGNAVGTGKELLVAYNSASPAAGAKTSGIKYLRFDPLVASGDNVAVDSAYVVEYDGSGMSAGVYAPRIRVTGDTLAQTFRVRAARYQENSAGTVLDSFVGAGCNKETQAEDEYMIFYFEHWRHNGTAWVSQLPTGWLKVPAAATVAKIEALNWASSLAELDDPKGYGTQVTDMRAANELFTTGDFESRLLQAATDFGAGGAADNHLTLP